MQNQDTVTLFLSLSESYRNFKQEYFEIISGFKGKKLKIVGSFTDQNIMYLVDHIHEFDLEISGMCAILDKEKNLYSRFHLTDFLNLDKVEAKYGLETISLAREIAKKIQQNPRIKVMDSID